MTLSPQFLDELRARTSLSALIGKSTKLQRAGREWKACCPFHNEKTPSFTVSDEKGFYHCLAAETVVLTRRGRARIRDLAGHVAEVLGPSRRWIAAPFAAYGEHRLWQIALSRNGVRKSIFATSRHRWFVHDRKAEVFTDKLRPGTRLLSGTPAPRSSWDFDPAGVRHGIVFGDGTLDHGVYRTINLHGPANMALAAWFTGQRHFLHHRSPAKPYFRAYGGRDFSHMKSLPDRAAGDAYLAGFLAGYFAADGHVAKDGTVMLHSARRDHLEAVRDIAAALDIVTYGITTQTRKGIGGAMSEMHRIHFACSTLVPEFFLKEEARRRFEEHSKAFERLRWTVNAVAPTDRVETVYCAEVPQDHAFVLDDDILTGNCFGCSAHGDAIRWLTDARGLAFMDAVKELADAAGMEVPAPDPRALARAERAAGLYEVMEAAARWFGEQLGGIEGSEARAYLKGRDIDEAAQRRFGFGLAPDSRGRLKAALKGFGNDKLIEAGLLIEPEGEEREPYDRFRGRLMIPIRDPRGRVIAFGGRILGAGEPPSTGSGQAKYLNSPETPLFDKGRTLYNLDRAGPAARETRRIIVVEGYMDVVALDQAGIHEAVAPLGTALTEGQLGLLWRLSPVPILCFDGDAAGQKAAVRAALRALPHVGPGRSLGFVTLPAGADPDDLVRARGRESFEALLERPEPLVDRLWRHELGAEPLATPEQRAGLRRRLIDHVSAIADADVRDQYRSELLKRFGDQVQPRQRFGDQGQARQRRWPGRPSPFFAPPRPTSPEAKAVGRTGLNPELGRAVLHGLARFPALIGRHGEAIADLRLSEPAAARLRDLMLEAAMAETELDPERLHTILAAKGAAALAEELGLRRGLAFSFTRRDADPERACRDLVLVIETLAARPGLDAALEAATARLGKAWEDAAFEEQKRLLAARDEADRQLATLFEADRD